MMFVCHILDCDCAAKAGELAVLTRHNRKAALYIASLKEDAKMLGPLNNMRSKQTNRIRRLRTALKDLVADVNEAKVVDWQSLSEAEAVLANDGSRPLRPYLFG